MQPNRRSSGLLLHPTSLPGSGGIGDLGAGAYAFVDFLVAAGQRVWQILPLGPTSLSVGNSPYMCASAFAGNPLLIDLTELVTEGLLSPATVSLPEQPGQRVDFKQASLHKLPLLKTAFNQFMSRPALHEPWLNFCAEQASWLADYALFMALKALYADSSWNTWPTPFKLRDPQALAEIREGLTTQIQFQQYVQYLFERQWQRLKSYANAQGIQILGDIPLYVAYDSADVWVNPQFFELDGDSLPIAVAGVPPDYFSVTGQLWGNPLFNWLTLRQQGYQWWIERVRGVLRLVDWVRIDHFRGFESYWRVPVEETTAIKGTWMAGPGPDIFMALRDALGDLPIVAEDLGVITPEVEQLRDQFGFPGMRILQFAFSNDPHNPHRPYNFVPNVLVYTGTHDNDTSVGWRDDRQIPEDYKRNFMDYLGKTQMDDVAWDFIRIALQSIAQTAILPLQDLLSLGTQHRMNTPGQGEGHWAWRYDPRLLTPEVAGRLLRLTCLYGRG